MLAPTAAVIDLAAERARRTPEARLILHRPPIWWAAQLASLAVIVACVSLLFVWIA